MALGLLLVFLMLSLSVQSARATSVVNDDDKLLAGCIATQKLTVGGAGIRLSYTPAGYALTAQQICEWTLRAAHAVTQYYGRFPVTALRIVLQPAAGSGVSGGTTYGASEFGTALIVIQLGRDADQSDLLRDWVMTHEMVHLSVPAVPERSHWLEEGIATYVEPVARVETGELEAAQIWADMRRGMQQGMPHSGDSGLDHTPTWGRTYWGGALFCLLADVEIRRRTDNRKGLQDALRGVLAAGGNIEQDWPVQRILDAGDAATGVPVLSELYQRLRAAPLPADTELSELWKSLGVVGEGSHVSLTDAAPLAAVRHAITQRRSTAPPR